MRKIVATVCLAAIAGTLSAQTNSFPPSGNVGIGTANPEKKLEVVGAIKANDHLWVTNPLNTSASVQLGWQDNVARIRVGGNGDGSFGGINIQRVADFSLLRILHNGNAGFGVTAPTHKLHVAGNAKWEGNASSYTEINSNSNGQYMIQYANNGTSRSWIIRGFSNNGVQAEFNNGGINVNGVIKTKEVNVTSSGWADHVFEPGYELMDLDRLEEFIRSKGHLPHIPTAAEVKETGVNLAEMNVKLLEKVEELTLYLINQRDEIRELRELIIKSTEIKQ